MTTTDVLQNVVEDANNSRTELERLTKIQDDMKKVHAYKVYRIHKQRVEEVVKKKTLASEGQTTLSESAI